MDIGLIKRLTEIQSGLSVDKEINEFIWDHLSKIDKITLSKDDFGNIYAIKGAGENGYKCIVSHTDTVHSIEKKRFIIKIDNTLFAFAKDENSTSGAKIRQVGIGGDDKCGVYTCIKAMEDFDNIKAVFFRFEESGCNGSKASNMEFFKDCNFVIECDRRGSSDFITHTNGISVCSQEFKLESKPIYEKYGYKECIGIATDIGVLRKRGMEISSINLSCGYNDPHSSKETIDLIDLDNCYNLVSDIFNTIGNKKYVFPLEVTHKENVNYSSKKKKGRFSYNANNNYFNDLLSIDIEIIEDNQSMFVNIDNTKFYKLIDQHLIFLDNNKCEKCKSESSLIFSPQDGLIYCSNSSKCGFLYNSESYKECIIEDNGVVFCFDKTSNSWIIEKDCYWDEELQTYQIITESLTV